MPYPGTEGEPSTAVKPVTGHACPVNRQTAVWNPFEMNSPPCASPDTMSGGPLRTTNMNPDTDPRVALKLGEVLGQRRAFSAVGGRCTAAYAQLLRRIHHERLYLPLAETWEEFCGTSLALSRRHADRLIALLDRFGPVYFEISQLIGLSPREYLEIEPAIRENSVLLNGEAISLIPEKAPAFIDALKVAMRSTRKKSRRKLVPEALRRRGYNVARELVLLYHCTGSEPDRELLRDTAVEMREILAVIA